MIPDTRLPRLFHSATLQDHRELLEAVGDADDYGPPAVPGAAVSLTQQEMLLSMMEEKVRKQGLKGTTFKKENVFFQQAMATCMDNMMVGALELSINRNLEAQYKLNLIKKLFRKSQSSFPHI